MNTISLIKRLRQLAQGQSVPASSFPQQVAENMLEEGVLRMVVHGSRRSLRMGDETAFRHYLKAHYHTEDVEKLYNQLTQAQLSRAILVSATGDSKTLRRRTCLGFLVNSYEPLTATLNGNMITVAPAEGSSLFIQDYERFQIPKEVVVVGFENMENFHCVRGQRALFEDYFPKGTHLLFVCRYPQNGDLVRWLQTIPNRYVHFGDLDLAGIHIYQSEYYRLLGSRASFFLPKDYEERLQRGSSQRYDVQYPRFHQMKAEDERLADLLRCIHQYHKGYDQEGFIDSDNAC
jgi:hypothetical protein